MRVYVNYEGQTYLIPCKDEKADIASLKHEVIKCCLKTAVDDESRYILTLSSGDAIIRDSDVIAAVLHDGDYLSLRLKDEPNCISFDWSLPSFGPVVSEKLRGDKIKGREVIELDGNKLTLEQLIKIGEGELCVALSESAIQAVKASRKVIDGIVERNAVVYGVTTGFGKFANVSIKPDELRDLQENLIRSHAAGVGSPLSPQKTRRLMALRINVLAKGYSGIRIENLSIMIDALNCSCLPYIPEKGTVGASGDLAPLSHLALGLMGEGKMWSPESGWASAREVLNSHNITSISLGPKEGLALINGTQFITAIGAEALHRAEMISKQADIVAALTLDALIGTPVAFDKDIHANRPHPGQQVVAARLRALLDEKNSSGSQIRDKREKEEVQDAYTLRCIPQVHGIVNDTIKFVKEVLETEMNSALDNPMVLVSRNMTISGGNFHGEYPAKVLDYLAIGVHELANISERRLERLINPAYNKDLPAFLVKQGGLNSGFMIAHCTSAALVSENKVLTHPSSVDSLSTSAGTEDHVSMGGFAARKALEIVEHVEQVLAIELLAACQALEFHRPLKTTIPLEKVYDLVREVVRLWDKDRYFAPDITVATSLLREGKVWQAASRCCNIDSDGI